MLEAFCVIIYYVVHVHIHEGQYTMQYEATRHAPSSSNFERQVAVEFREACCIIIYYVVHVHDVIPRSRERERERKKDRVCIVRRSGH